MQRADNDVHGIRQATHHRAAWAEGLGPWAAALVVALLGGSAGCEAEADPPGGIILPDIISPEDLPAGDGPGGASDALAEDGDALPGDGDPGDALPDDGDPGDGDPGDGDGGDAEASDAGGDVGADAPEVVDTEGPELPSDDADAGPPAPLPTSGQLVITEIMPNPAAVSDAVGEWFEITHVGDTPLTVAGCVVSDSDDDDSVLTATDFGAVMAPGDVWVAARSQSADANGGVEAQLAYDLGLKNGNDLVRLVCGSEVVDEVIYDADTHRLSPGVALQLNPSDPPSAVDNDVSSRWCEAPEAFGEGDLGSPGEANPPCAGPDLVPDACRLVAPLELFAAAGGEAVGTVELFEDGLTDATGGVDAGAEGVTIVVQVGLGPSGSTPDAPTWTWTTLGPLDGWDDTSGGAPTVGWDRYEGPFALPEASLYDVAGRVSLDGGVSYLTCGAVADVPYTPGSGGSVTTVPNPCFPNPCVDPPPATCDGDIATQWQTPGSCAPSVDVAVCDYVSGEVDCALTGASCEAGACVGDAPAPGPGELVFSEVMRDPSAVPDGDGEWVELFNPTDGVLQLDGCTLGTADGEVEHTLPDDAGLYVPAKGFVVLGRKTDPAANGGAPVDYAYGNDVTLQNGSDGIVLRCGGELGADYVVDAIAWSPGFAGTAGEAANLEPAFADTLSNDDSASWCDAASPYGDGDLGTPGAPNDTCFGYLIELCRLEAPTALTDGAGTFEVFEGRVKAPGLTDLSGATDVNPVLTVELGIGPDGSDPTSDPSAWTFWPASASPGWTDALAPGEDAYERGIALPAPGTYDVAFRVSISAGATWTYCDTATGELGEDGSENGYAPDDAGSLVTLAGPCHPDPCGPAPADTCLDGFTLQASIGGAGCSVVAGAASCEFPTVEVDCLDQGALCEAGACDGVVPTAAFGQLAITEIMKDPLAVSDSAGEWFEVKHVGNAVFDLEGCELRDAGSDVHVIATGTPLLVLPGEYVVFARSDEDNGGIEPDYVYGGFSLSNDADQVQVWCGGVLLDEIAYDDATFPDQTGAAMSVRPDNESPFSNDAGTVWCSASVPYGDGDLGTPGEPNTGCPTPQLAEGCRLTGPSALELAVGSSQTYGVELFQPGLTDVTEGTDPHPWIEVQVLAGPAGTPPLPDTPGWQTLSALPDEDWIDAADPGWDRWLADVSPNQAGDLIVAGRVTVDDGLTWELCDLGVGLDNGFQIDQTATIAAFVFDPCAPNPCTSPPAAACNGDVLETFDIPGTCEDVGGVAECGWTPVSIDCAAAGGTCEPSGCAGIAPAPSSGDFVLTELRRNSPLGEPTGSFLELTNVGGFQANIGGCQLTIFDSLDVDAVPTQLHVLGGSAPLIVPSDARLVVASEPQTFGPLGPPTDVLVEGLELPPAGTDLRIELHCPAAVIPELPVDVVTLDAALTAETGDGEALQVDPASADSAGNDAATAWCPAYTSTPDGGLGTPGQPNDPCPSPNAVDGCQLLGPDATSLPAGEVTTYTVAIAEPGLTDATVAADAHPFIRVQVLVGPTAIDADLASPDPTESLGGWWQVEAGPDPTWNALTGDDLTLDRWVAEVVAPSPGAHPVAARVTVDDGLTWTSCDLDGPVTAGAGTSAEAAWATLTSLDEGPCGGGACDGEVTPEPFCDGDIARTPLPGGLCTVADGAAVCATPLTSESCPAAGLLCVSGQCAEDGGFPQVFDLVFTELHIDPGAVADTAGEWVEISNTTGQALDLQACSIGPSSAELFPLTEGDPLWLAPKSSLVVGRKSDPALNGGFVPDVVSTSLGLTNSGGQLVLVCDGLELDAILWSDSWPYATGVAMQIGLDDATPTVNDSQSNWCAAFTAYGDGDLGSPGVANDACPPLGPPADCRVLAPDGVVTDVASPVLAQAVVSAPGLTDVTTGTDPISFVQVELWWGPAGTSPAAGPQSDAWVATALEPDATWDALDPDAVAAGLVTSDRYAATVPAPSAGAYSVLARATVDGGQTWAWCDKNGLTDGGTNAAVGSIGTVEPPLCDDSPCTSPPDNVCLGGVATTYPAVGGCTVVNAEVLCDYPASTLDCVALGGTCGPDGCEGIALDPQPGEVVLSELHVDPQFLSDSNGEWFELYNWTEDNLLLEGCDIWGNNTLEHTIASPADAPPLTIGPGDVLLLSRTANPGGLGDIPPDYVYSGIALNNGPDTLRIDCAGQTILEVTWETADGLDTQLGASTQLSLVHMGGGPVPDDADYCPGVVVFGTGDKGTPGQPNTVCPSGGVDYCTLAIVPTLGAEPGGPVPVDVHIVETGLTDLSSGVDTSPSVFVLVGWTADPSVAPSLGAPGWDLISAVPTAGWNGPAIGLPVTDSYSAVLSAPDDVGTYALGASVSIDGGLTFQACDLGPSGDGWVPEQAGELVVTDSTPCDPNPCDAPPANACDDNVAILYPSLGICTAPTGLVPECFYEPAPLPCDEFGLTCLDGDCASGAPLPEPGDLAVVEFHAAPLAGAAGEYVELVNLASGSRDLTGCVLGDGGDDAHVIAPTLGTLIVESGGIVLLARQADPAGDGSVTPDYVYGATFTMADGGGDAIVLTCDSQEIDSVAFDGTFPAGLGVAAQVEPAAWGADNALAATWCPAPNTFGAGTDLGSPGLPNPPCGGAANPSPTAAGDILVTEFHPDPLVSGSAGEWVELHNPTGGALELAGCTIGDLGSNNHVIAPASGSFVLQAGAYAVLAREALDADNGGLTSATASGLFYAYGAGMTLTNGSDEVVLTCGGAIIDQIAYAEDVWPYADGVTASLSAAALDSDTNDTSTSWCFGTVPYGLLGDLGTPGAANPVCDVVVDDCLVLDPGVSSVSVFTPIVVEILLDDPGLTDATDGIDLAPGLAVDVGLGLDGGDPGSEDDYVWIPAEPQDPWSALASGVAGYDGWLGTIFTTFPGEFDVIARASRDGGATWTICDLTGSTDGFSPADAVDVTVE